MTLGIASFITFRQADFSTVVARYQNFWPAQTVDLHSFYPFDPAAIVSNAAGGQQSLSVSFAASAEILALIEAGLANAYLVELAYYYFTPTANGTPPTAKTLFASFIGELINATQDEASVSIRIGSSLNPVEAQAPPRKFTSTLIGDPPKI
jgi:hypothetical protein